MFKHLSDILAQFAASQRMRALAFLLVSAIIILLGRQFITSTNSSPEEMKATIQMQKEQIIDNQKNIYCLNITVRALNDTILDQNRTCNESMIAVEKNYTQKLIEQQRYVIRTIEEMMRARQSTSKMIYDTTEQQMVVVDDDMSTLLQQLKVKFGQTK